MSKLRRRPTRDPHLDPARIDAMRKLAAEYLNHGDRDALRVLADAFNDVGYTLLGGDLAYLLAHPRFLPDTPRAVESLVERVIQALQTLSFGKEEPASLVLWFSVVRRSPGQSPATTYARFTIYWLPLRVIFMPFSDVAVGELLAGARAANLQAVRGVVLHEIVFLQPTRNNPNAYDDWITLGKKFLGMTSTRVSNLRKPLRKW